MTDSARQGRGGDEEHKRACEEVGRPPGSENGDFCFGSKADISARHRVRPLSANKRNYFGLVGALVFAFSLRWGPV